MAWRVLRDDVAIADLPPEVTTHSDSGLRPGVTYRYAVRPLDAPPGELGATTSVRTPPVVPVAPLPVLDLRAVVQARRVVVSWRMPPSRARPAVVVVRRRGRPPAGRLDGQVLLRGRRTVLVDHPVSARPVHYAVWTVDDAGRSSPVARVRIGRFLPALRTPAEAASVGARPVLRWRRVPGAAYYNVQVWRGTRLRKVVTAWPAGPSYRPAALRPGRYTWYVYPGFGPRRAVRYGPLIGAGTFRVVRPRSAPSAAAREP